VTLGAPLSVTQPPARPPSNKLAVVEQTELTSLAAGAGPAHLAGRRLLPPALLSDSAVADLRADLQRRVLALHDAEVAAYAALSAVLAG
jgi:hypothetical protein